MCTLAIYFQKSAALPVVVAANRDEFYSRPTAEPRVIAHDPWIVAGQDLSAGGTWLGTNEYSLVVGLLNRRRPEGPDPTRRSRGLLCLEALQLRSPAAVLELLQRQRPADYNWFNLLVADPGAAYVISNAEDRMTVTTLSPGLHLLTNLTVNDPTCPRIAKSFRLFEEILLPTRDDGHAELLRRLRVLLSDHQVPLDPRLQGLGNTLCLHSANYGTRSSSVLLYVQRQQRISYWHAPGPPCETPYMPVSLPFGRPAGQATED